MAFEQQALTVVAPLKKPNAETPEQLEKSIAATLQQMKATGEKLKDRLHNSTRTHFARFVVSRDTRGIPDRLIFTTSFDGNSVDGDEDSYIKELVAACNNELENMFGFCDGFQNGVTPEKFIHQFKKKANLFFISLPGLRAAVIRNLRDVRRIFEDLVDGHEAIFRAFEHLAGLNRPHRLETPLSLFLRMVKNRARHLFRWIGRARGKVRKAIFEWFAGIKTSGANPNVSLAKVPPIVEDHGVQNALTVVVPIKNSWKSRLKIRRVLWFGNLYFFFFPPRGSLSGVTSVHFARWVLLDGAHNLMFESNYDGSWDSYIDNFVDVTAAGLNLIWGNAEGYPARGCEDTDSFKAIIRKYQAEPILFYSAYPDLTVKNIITNYSVGVALQRSLATPDIQRVFAGYYETDD